MRTIHVNGARLAFIDEGQGAPLLLLHGLGGSADDWRLQRAEFAARYRVVIPDLRGFGASRSRFRSTHATWRHCWGRSASAAPT